MKAHIGVDADSGLVRWPPWSEEQVWANSGYRGAQTRVPRDDLQWHIAARPNDIAKLPEGRATTRVRRE